MEPRKVKESSMIQNNILSFISFFALILLMGNFPKE